MLYTLERYMPDSANRVTQEPARWEEEVLINCRPGRCGR